MATTALRPKEKTIAVEQNPDDLNEIAEAGLTTPGDAREAWQVIAACLAAGRDLPDWVKGYLRRVAGNVAEVNGLVAPPFEFYPESEDMRTYRKKGLYDDLAVFSVIEGWRLEAHNAGKKLSLQRCFERYVIEREKGNAEEETIKTAYYKGRDIAANELALAEAIQPTAEAKAWPKS